MKAKKLKSKGVGFSGVKMSLWNRLKVLLIMIKADVLARFGMTFKNDSIGVRVGASVENAQVSIQVLMKYGNHVTVGMNIDAARQIINELNKAISMVSFKGR